MLGIDPVAMMVGLGLLALLPFLAVMVTSYVKLVVVFGLLRNAMGIQQIPPNMVVNSMAILLTLFIMAPVGQEMYRTAAESGITELRGVGDLDPSTLDRAAAPLRAFLKKHSHPSMRILFLHAAAQLWGGDESRLPDPEGLFILAPAFMLTELTEAFQAGFLLYLPFVVVDLVISNILLAMGMMMVSPMTISLPFKLLLFVMINGWTKVIEGLVSTYR
ncbi:MAG: type III secretion system export apparatus subunit SctR [Planctomycetota bacterium]|jgi:type III secretion protein R|nr:type III secretion system export apparatus subunit SctR [Planctomycetota bacterium]